jgi:hypothetical protein
VLSSATHESPNISLAIRESTQPLPGYATLDAPHRQEIARLVANFSAYVGDKTRKRPLNALMLAEPGAGKSHFIKCIAEKMRNDRVHAVTFNMATMQNYDDLAQPMDELRNIKVNDRFPLLFLDEFDSDPRWYATLLPLLWDGELHIGHRDLRLGKSIVVLAGSNPSLPRLMKEAGSMQRREQNETADQRERDGKLVDLLSRINSGVIEIPSLDLKEPPGRDRRVDKVCIAVSLLFDRFSRQLEHVPKALLRFVASVQFRYGVRSIAHLVDLIDTASAKNGTLTLRKLGLPLNDRKALGQSSLSLHLSSADGALGIVNLWDSCCKKTQDIRVKSESSIYFSLADATTRRRKQRPRH